MVIHQILSFCRIERCAQLFLNLSSFFFQFHVDKKLVFALLLFRIKNSLIQDIFVKAYKKLFSSYVCL